MAMCVCFCSILPFFAASGFSSAATATRSSSFFILTTAFIIVFKDKPDFNAGYGLNLTFEVGTACGMCNLVLHVCCVLEGRIRYREPKQMVSNR